MLSLKKIFFMCSQEEEGERGVRDFAFGGPVSSRLLTWFSVGEGAPAAEGPEPRAQNDPTPPPRPF